MILIIDKQKKVATSLSDAFLNMGILARGCTPSEALSEISEIYRAAVITSPQSLADIGEFTERMRRYASGVPLFAVVPEDKKEEYSSLFAAVFTKGSYASKIADGLVKYAEENSLPVPSRYTLAGIDASADLPAPTYFWTALPFTKTETMILRYLICSYPTPVSAEKILFYSYRPSRMPDIANIRTHVSVMNKKFRMITGRNIIEPVFNCGYRLLTPELVEAAGRE